MSDGYVLSIACKIEVEGDDNYRVALTVTGLPDRESAEMVAGWVRHLMIENVDDIGGVRDTAAARTFFRERKQ